MPDSFRLSVVIPVYNEARTLAEVVRRVRACGLPVEIILVDDGSTDGSCEILQGWRGEADIQLIIHETNQGKGAALRSGFKLVRGDVVIVQDADLEYDPAEYPLLVQPIVEGTADVAFGSRFIGHRHHSRYFWHAVGNYVLTSFSNLTTHLKLTDMETGCKAFRRDVIERIAPMLRENRFGIEPELVARIARIPGIRISEIPITYRGRTYREGKKITWRDGFWALWCILRYCCG